MGWSCHIAGSSWCGTKSFSLMKLPVCFCLNSYHKGFQSMTNARCILLQYGLKIIVMTSFKDTYCIEILPKFQKPKRGNFFRALSSYYWLVCKEIFVRLLLIVFLFMNQFCTFDCFAVDELILHFCLPFPLFNSFPWPTFQSFSHSSCLSSFCFHNFLSSQAFFVVSNNLSR